MGEHTHQLSGCEAGRALKQGIWGQTGQPSGTLSQKKIVDIKYVIYI
jgi:hypothetical protein